MDRFSFCSTVVPDNSRAFLTLLVFLAPAHRFKALEGSNGLPKDVVEPPKFITAKHVSAMFEKLGFDPSCGQKVVR